jgi:hypothetical protein|tara:strand:+ start:28 stop:168 length:141 start_codon:yes stop_codon:yes gene_type:complete
MWRWIKNIFKPRRQYEEVKIDLTKLTKGDLKKLKAQGKIKNIYERH